MPSLRILPERLMGAGLEVPMKGREERRDRTIRYGERARRIHLRQAHPNGSIDCVCEQSAWFFAKGKAVGCRCRRRWPGRPKLALSTCHGAGYGYHPSVVERIAGSRLARGWLSEQRGAEPDDVEL